MPYAPPKMEATGIQYYTIQYTTSFKRIFLNRSYHLWSFCDICGLLYEAVTKPVYTASTNRLVNNELESTWKEETVINLRDIISEFAWGVPENTAEMLSQNCLCAIKIKNTNNKKSFMIAEAPHVKQIRAVVTIYLGLTFRRHTEPSQGHYSSWELHGIPLYKKTNIGIISILKM
jgi:hypothetical protein